MQPVGADPFPPKIEIIRRRRRSVELRLEDGRLLARVPSRISRRELDEILPHLRAQLWTELSKKRVFDEEALQRCATRVVEQRLSDLELPPYRIRFTTRQHRRWGSCTYDPSVPEGRIRISERLRGHPVWILEHLILHELIHLKIPDHGPRFHAMMERCPHFERAEGYLEALEGLALLGEDVPQGEALLGGLEERLELEWEQKEGEILLAALHGLQDLPLFTSSASARAPRESRADPDPLD